MHRVTAFCSSLYLWSPCPVLPPGSRQSSLGFPQLCASGQTRRHCTRECCLVQRRSPAVHSHPRFSPLALRTTGRIVKFMPHLKNQPPWACPEPIGTPCNRRICYFKKMHLMSDCFVKITFSVIFRWLHPNFVQCILIGRCINETNFCLAWIVQKQ